MEIDDIPTYDTLPVTSPVLDEKGLLEAGEIIKIGGGRYTSYVWNWEAEK